MNTQIKNRFTASLHTHVRSLLDADIKAKDLVKRVSELGGKAVAITDHAVLSAIEDYRPVFKDAGIKLIPGCELFISRDAGKCHLVIIAKNDNGYKGISKIVTESNKTLLDDFPSITEDRLFGILKDYKGDIIGLSGCFNGVLNTLFLSNAGTESKIRELTKERDTYYAPGSNAAISSHDVFNSCTWDYEDAIRLRDETKAIAEMKFTKRMKTLELLKKNGEDYAQFEAELNADIARKEKAMSELGKCKEVVNDTKKSLANARKVYKEVEASVAKWNQINEEIESLKSTIKTEEELMADAREMALTYINEFGEGNFYAELQYHGLQQETESYHALAKLVTELQIPVVATNDVHMLFNTEEEVLKRDILRSIALSKKDDTFYSSCDSEKELYLKDNYELYDWLVRIFPEDMAVEAINNIDVITDACDVQFETGKHYPKFSSTEDANTLLDAEIEKGIKWRFPEGMDDEHKARLDYELKIIKEMGYADYHLIVKDFLEYGRLLGYIPEDELDEAPLTIAELKDYIDFKGYKNAGFTIGPGRGSAVGSEACFLLGITALDPIKYGLLFERFLNPERVSMPDIDSDIANTTRQKVIEYVRNKYGNMAVCAIMTTTMQAPKGAINIAAKYYGIKNYGESMLALGRTIAKDVPSDVGTSFSTIVDENGNVAEEGTNLIEYLNKKYASSKDALEIIRWASVLEGSFTAYGAHAAGVVISDNQDVSDYIPLRYNSEMNMFSTQCDMVQVEDNGLLKFDMLGLKTLDIITDTIRLVEKEHGVILDPLKIDIEDADVYKNILSNGRTNSVFQFESSGMKTMLKRFKPTCFEDLIILVSMYRPGPLQYLDGVIDVKNGKKEMTFLCDELKPILSKTYGGIVYQEQVMEICQKLAGYTLGGADTVRRYMSKKKADKLAHEVDTFIEGCKKNGISQEVATTLFAQMQDFARYAFNKSHAAAYAYIAYITAWLKYHYSAEFYASALNWVSNKKLPGLVHEASEMGVKIRTPDVNISDKKVVASNGEIRLGLAMVAGVKNQANSIIAYRNKNGAFNNFKDFLTSINIHSDVCKNLISAGAFDEFNTNRASLKRYVDETKGIISDINKKVSFIKSAECVYTYLLANKEATSQDVISCQEGAGLKIEIKEITTPENLLKRIENAKKSLSVLRKDLDCVRFTNEEEDFKEKMSLEKEYLGMYITMHPLDRYPLASEMGCKEIDDLDVTDDVCYGAITNLSIKQRKKDGADMAFFTLEDKSGSIDVCCFVKQYQRNKHLIEEGKAVKLYGSIQTEEYENIDGEIETSYKFMVETVEDVKEKAPSIIKKVPSYAIFHLYHEKNFIEMFQKEDGRVFYIHDEQLNEVRKMTYKVDPSVLKCVPDVCEVNL